MRKRSFGRLKVTTFEKPPTDFDFLSAKPKDLIRYGLPSIPAQDHRYRNHFEFVIRRWIAGGRYIVPEFDVRKRATRKGLPRTGRSASPPVTQGVGLPNWCGAETGPDFTDDPIKWISCDLLVPNASSPSQIGDYISSHWVGIGQTSLIQTGVECDGLPKQKSNVYPWWEFLPAQPALIKITNYPVAAGDLVSLLICTDSGTGSTDGTIYWANLTAGYTTSFGFSSSGAALVDGNKGEWISECPLEDEKFDPTFLANFGGAYFGNCVGGTVKNVLVNPMNAINMTSQDAAATLYATGQIYSPDVVRTVYAGPIRV